jgi:hypothetical protein
LKTDRFEPEFVDSFPNELEPEVLYVSMKYATTAHLCASGCGNKVVLPLSPAEWKLLFDGEAITLTPSVGNWEYPCRAHYWIRENTVHWAGAWTKDQIENGRANDQRDLNRHFDSVDGEPTVPVASRPSIWTQLLNIIFRR